MKQDRRMASGGGPLAGIPLGVQVYANVDHLVKSAAVHNSMNSAFVNFDFKIVTRMIE